MQVVDYQKTQTLCKKIPLARQLPVFLASGGTYTPHPAMPSAETTITLKRSTCPSFFPTHHLRKKKLNLPCFWRW
jgi:hypothetical protein